MPDETPHRPAQVSHSRRHFGGCGFRCASLVGGTGVCEDWGGLSQTGYRGGQSGRDGSQRKIACPAEGTRCTRGGILGFERALAELFRINPAAFDDALERAEGNRFAPVRGDDDLMSIGVPPFLMAAFLRDKGEAVPAQNAGDFGGGADRVVAAHVSATSSTLAPAGRSRETGSNHSARASRALAMASSSVSPALAQPGISGKTADQRSVDGSCSTTRRTFITDM